MILTRGLSSSVSSRFIQIGGVLSSIFSVAKFCTEWHLYTGFNCYVKDKTSQIPPQFIPTLKALLLFFLPHVLFRTTSTAVVLAFFKIYSLLPFILFLFLSIGITCYLSKSHKQDLHDTLIRLPISLFTPAALRPFTKFNRRLLKSTMLASTLTILPCLLLLLLLPHLFHPSTLLCTWGLDHINLPTNKVPSCSSCLNATLKIGQTG